MDLSSARVKKYLSVILQFVGAIMFFSGLLYLFKNSWYWGLLIVLTGIFIVVLSVILDKRDRGLNR
ncbi:hypothetical protein ACFLXN_00165 [Chloroflexota bacterium]